MTSTASTLIEVRPDQVWADNDPRSAGRTVRVLALTTDAAGREVARVETLTNADCDQALIDTHGAAAGGTYVGRTYVPKDCRGRTSTIRVDRMRPTSTGYRLVHETPPCRFCIVGDDPRCPLCGSDE